MLRMLAAGFLVASLQAGSALAPPAGDPPDEPTVPTERVALTVITVNGSGCTDSVTGPEITSEMAPDNGSFAITFSPRYRASVGVGARPTDLRKNCQVSVMIDVPVGYSYAIAKTEQAGDASIVDGASAAYRWNMYSAGVTVSAQQARRVAGPYDGSWVTTHPTAPEETVWHPCGDLRYVNLNTELRVAVGTSDRATTASSIGLRTSTYRLAWRLCTVP